MNPVQQTSTISSPCYETIFICQSCSADTKNTENVGVVLQVDKGPVGLGTTLEVAKQKFLAKKPITKRKTNHCPQKPSAHRSSYKHTQPIGNQTKLTPYFFLTKHQDHQTRSNITSHQGHQPPKPFKGNPPGLGVFQSARHKLSCTTTITGRLTQLPGMTGSRR